MKYWESQVIDLKDRGAIRAYLFNAGYLASIGHFEIKKQRYKTCRMVTIEVWNVYPFSFRENLEPIITFKTLKAAEEYVAERNLDYNK